MTEPQNHQRQRGLFVLIAMDLSTKRAWTAEKYDPAVVFATSYGDLREAVALGREVRKAPNKNNIHGRIANCIKTLRDGVNSRFQNWQPTGRELMRPY
jgi:hypothetical protein